MHQYLFDAITDITDDLTGDQHGVVLCNWNGPRPLQQCPHDVESPSVRVRRLDSDTRPPITERISFTRRSKIGGVSPLPIMDAAVQRVYGADRARIRTRASVVSCADPGEHGPGHERTVSRQNSVFARRPWRVHYSRSGRQPDRPTTERRSQAVVG